MTLHDGAKAQGDTLPASVSANHFASVSCKCRIRRLLRSEMYTNLPKLQDSDQLQHDDRRRNGFCRIVCLSQCCKGGGLQSLVLAHMLADGRVAIGAGCRPAKLRSVILYLDFWLGERAGDCCQLNVRTESVGYVDILGTSQDMVSLLAL